MKLFFTLLFPCFFLLNACGGTTWIKQQTSAKEQAVALELIQSETEKEKPENLPQETSSSAGLEGTSAGFSFCFKGSFVVFSA